MGKDVRGTEGGKCACGECEDFVRSDGATCGYCGCLPTRHSEKDARYSPTLLVVHRVREQVKVQVHRSGKMKTWGGSRTQRANILNSQIILTLMYLNSYLNPVIYCWKMRTVRHAIMDLLRKMSWNSNRPFRVNYNGSSSVFHIDN